MNILGKLYDGEISPAEDVIPDSEEYRQKKEEKKRVKEELKKVISSDHLPLLEKLCALHLSIAEEECRTAYAEGVRFGIGLMTEIKQMDEKHPVIIPKSDN